MAEIIKRIGPAGYWCRRCANCNSIELGCIDDVPIYTCSDPYDCIEKKIPGDENITCTMFKLANEVPVYELKNKKAEQTAREKQKELEDKVDKYEDILVDICDALDPHFDFDKYDDDMEAFENFPSRILDLKSSCKDNFDECIRKMDIINELKAENAKLKDRVDGSYNIRKDELIEHLREKSKNYEQILIKYGILKENVCNRYGYPAYAARKAEDKIEHIQKEARKWKRKYKEAYDILETYFKYDLDGMEFDVSYDDINLTLRYSTPNGDKGNEYKYNALVSAYERLKKL